VTSRAEEGTKYINREEVLCAIKVYNSGNIDMTPGFSPKPNIKVDVMKGNSYKLSSDMGAVGAALCTMMHSDRLMGLLHSRGGSSMWCSTAKQSRHSLQIHLHIGIPACIDVCARVFVSVCVYAAVSPRDGSRVRV